MTDDNLATLAVLPLLLHRPGDLTFLAVQHRASGRFANIPFTVQADGYIGRHRRRAAPRHGASARCSSGRRRCPPPVTTSI